MWSCAPLFARALHFSRDPTQNIELKTTLSTCMIFHVFTQSIAMQKSVGHFYASSCWSGLGSQCGRHTTRPASTPPSKVQAEKYQN